MGDAMEHLPEDLRNAAQGEITELAKKRLVLLDELHRRFDAMPDDTLDQRIRKVYMFMKYSFKYPHGIDHPELFEE